MTAAIPHPEVVFVTDLNDVAPGLPSAFLDGDRSRSSVRTPTPQRSRMPSTDGRPGRDPVPIEDADVDDLRRKLASLPVIEQAKGMVMGLYGCDADTAFAMLQRWSRNHNRKLRVLCTDLTTAAAQPNHEPFGALRHFLQTSRLD